MQKLILVVDHIPDGLLFLERSLRKNNVTNSLRVVPDGIAAIGSLYGLDQEFSALLNRYIDGWDFSASTVA